MPPKQTRKERGKIDGTRITYSKSGASFEIVCHSDIIANAAPDRAPPPEEAVLRDIVIYRQRGLKTGNKATRCELAETFGSSDPSACAAAIIADYLKRKFRPAVAGAVRSRPGAEDGEGEPQHDPDGPFGLPSDMGFDAENTRKASIAWSRSGWSRKHSSAIAVVSWLQRAMELAPESKRVEHMALRCIARSGALRYWEPGEDREQKHVFAPLKSQARTLLASESPSLAQYAREQQLDTKLGSIEDRACDGGAGHKPTITQEPYLAIMDPDLYYRIDRLTAAEGFVFTETAHRCMMAIVAQFLDPLFVIACRDLTRESASEVRKIEPKSTWQLQTTDDGGCTTIRDDFLPWGQEVGYDSSDELDDDLVASWTARPKQGLVTGAHVLDALRADIVSESVDQQLVAWSHLPHVFSNVLRSTNPFTRGSDVDLLSPPCVSANVLFEPGMTYVEVVGSPLWAEAIARAKEAFHPDDDDEDFDMAANVLKDLLPTIGSRRVAMIAEVRFFLDFYAKAMDRIPFLWSVIEESNGLRVLERSCERYHDAVPQVLAVSLEGRREEGCLNVICRKIDGAEIASVSIRDGEIETWADVRPRVDKVCGARDITVRYVLPDGTLISNSSGTKTMAQLLSLPKDRLSGEPCC